jgi:hypothetical protein
VDKESAARLVGKKVICLKDYQDWNLTINEKYEIASVHYNVLKIKTNCCQRGKEQGHPISYGLFTCYFKLSAETLSERVKETLFEGKPLKIKDLLI